MTNEEMEVGIREVSPKQFRAIEAYWAAQAKENPPTCDDGFVPYTKSGRLVLAEAMEG